MTVLMVPSNHYQRLRWRNGLGWTRVIHAGRLAPATAPAATDDASDHGWDWRLSIAEIDADAPFSEFPGIEREMVLLSGNGLRLRFGDGETRRLEPPHGRARFAGERGVAGELLDGPTQAFNLMWRRDRVHADLLHRPLVGPMLLFVEPGTAWSLHMLGGQAHFEDATGLPPLAATDSAVFQAADRRLRYVIEGGGEVLLARLQPAAG